MSRRNFPCILEEQIVTQLPDPNKKRQGGGYNSAPADLGGSATAGWDSNERRATPGPSSLAALELRYEPVTKQFHLTVKREY